MGSAQTQQSLARRTSVGGVFVQDLDPEGQFTLEPFSERR